MADSRFPLSEPYARGAHLAAIGSTWLAVCLIIASTWLVHRGLESLAATDIVANDVRLAELAAETLLSTLKDAETGQRGYLLTGDASYLGPYEAARANFDGKFQQLQNAPLTDPERSRLIEHIGTLSAQKLDELQQTVTLYQSGQHDAALAKVRTNQGAQIMTALRADIDALQKDATSRIRQLAAPTDAYRLWGPAIGAGTLAFVLLGGVALQQRKARLRVTSSLFRLDRFTRAFGLTQGMMRQLDGRIIFWSQGAERLYGYQPEQALGHRSHDLLHTIFPQPLADIQAVLLRDGLWQGELVHLHRDGSRLYVASHWALHRGEANEADVIIEVNNNITDLKHAEDDLRQSELKLRLVLEASAQGVWQWEQTEGTGKLTCDQRCKVLLGLTEDGPIDAGTWFGTLAAADRAIAESSMRRALDPADPDDAYNLEHQIVRSDGTVVWVAVAGRALFETDRSARANRRPVRILGTMRDISERKRAEIERERSDALLRTIVETAPALIYAKDRKGRLLLANALVLALIGKPWDAVRGRSDREFLDDLEQAEAVMLNDRRVMEQGQAERLEEIVSGPQGQARTWASTKAPLCGENGDVIGLVGISVDITEQKQAEERLRLMIAELNHRVKNTLATVQALTAQTLRTSDPGPRLNLEARLLALASAHDVLTRESWKAGPLRDIVTEALAPFDGWNAARFWISGPAVSLRPAAAVAMAMGLHELATNAVKFGALSNALGRIEIRWEVSEAEDAILRFQWTERGGPEVLIPDRRGFGVRLVERTLAQDMHGTAQIHFDDPRGVVCRIEVPLVEVLATTTSVPFPRIGHL
jgi:PAS domain S-box-containing protein